MMKVNEFNGFNDLCQTASVSDVDCWNRTLLTNNFTFIVSYCCYYFTLIFRFNSVAALPCMQKSTTSCCFCKVIQQRNYGAVVNFDQHLDADYFCPQCRKSHEYRTAITKVVAINFRGAVFCNSQCTSVWKTINHKCQQHEISDYWAEQENKTSAIKNNATKN